MKRYSFALLLTVISFNCLSQQIFQDASGNTQITPGINSRGFLFYNTTDKSATIGYNHNNFADNHEVNAGGYDWRALEADFTYGIDLKIKTADGIGNVFNNKAVNPGFTLAGNAGIFKDSFFKHHFLNITVRGELGYNQYNYIHTVNPTYQLDKIKKVEGGGLLTINTQFNRVRKDSLRSYFFIGLQSGYKKLNNYEDLDDGQINTTVSEAITQRIETSETGKLGDYDGWNVIPLNIDLAVTPRLFKTNYIGFNAYYRTNFRKTLNTSNAGVGVYLADPQKPSQISGGIGWQFNDLHNKLGKETNLLGRSSVFFYVGFAIGSK